MVTSGEDEAQAVAVRPRINRCCLHLQMRSDRLVHVILEPDYKAHSQSQRRPFFLTCPKSSRKKKKSKHTYRFVIRSLVRVLGQLTLQPDRSGLSGTKLDVIVDTSTFRSQPGGSPEAFGVSWGKLSLVSGQPFPQYWGRHLLLLGEARPGRPNQHCRARE